jgi:hypothetical protein
MHTLVRTRSLSAGVKSIIASYPPSSLNPVHARTAGSKDGRVQRAGLRLVMAGGQQVALGRMGVRSDGFQVALRSVH